MRTTRWVLAAALLALFAAPMAAQKLKITGTYNGTYGPYKAEITDASGFPNPGAVPGFPNIDVYCVDFAHRISIYDEWTVQYTSLSDLLGLQNDTYWGRTLGISALDLQIKYQQAAWLSLQFWNTNDERTEWKGIHYALWHVFSTVPAGEVLPNGVLGSAYWYDQATNPLMKNWESVNLDYWHVISDPRAGTTEFDQYAGQEYLTYVTPEPATIFLMGTGLVAVLGMTLVTRRSLG